jgi:protein-L-isoaspartate O-methyltransferase
MAEPWNVNIHYDGRLDDCVPPRAASVLEVGCGDGFLAARLSKRLPNVVAVDIDEPVLEPAKQRFPTAPVKWLCGDILAMADELWDFDAVVTFARPGWRHLPWALATLAIRGVAIRLRSKWEQRTHGMAAALHRRGATSSRPRGITRRTGVATYVGARLHPVGRSPLITPAGALS